MKSPAELKLWGTKVYRKCVPLILTALRLAHCAFPVHGASAQPQAGLQEILTPSGLAQPKDAN